MRLRLWSVMFLLGGGGCISAILPMNAGADFDFSDGLLAQPEGAALKSVVAREDVLQLEIERLDGQGSIVGFISPLDAHNGALVLLFDGAATYQEGASVGAALDHYDKYGAELREAGFVTWSVALAECASAYGDGDLADAIEVVDWLDAGGGEFLGVERVYAVGYSTGATVVNLLNTQYQLAAVVSMGGLTEPDQLERLYDFYSFLVKLFPRNVGLCQMGATLDEYGDPGAPAWEGLDTVSRIEQFLSPMLFIQGDKDVIYFLENLLAMQARYEALLAEGVTGLAELEFVILPDRGHFAMREDPDVRALVVEYLLQFEP